MGNFQQEEYRDKDACGIGAVVNIDGRKEYKVLDRAISIVEKLEHRAGKDATGKVGDGVGILTQISHRYFAAELKKEGIDPGEEGDYGIGMFFLPQNQLERTLSTRMFEVIAEKNGMEVLHWRTVPVQPAILGEPARRCMPCIMQCFLRRPAGVEKGKAFDRALYVLRREYEQSVHPHEEREDGKYNGTYVCSLSSRTITYKGMFLVGQLRRFYKDLQSRRYETAIAMVHSRFSTNTTPSWERAHPYRFVAHNGEINTIRGNVDRMLAREETMCSPLIDRAYDKIFPMVDTAGSDSAIFDNALEFMYMNGIDLPLGAMMMIPEPWKHTEDMPREKKDFYHYYSTMMEPWDGPAAVIFTDGEVLGATLDRNGLRPSRYCITDENQLILASEAGVVDVAPEHILKKSRLQPGKILLVDTKQQRIISDTECKDAYARRQPYGEWLDRNLRHLACLPIPNKKVPAYSKKERAQLYKVFGYTYEDVNDMIRPMAENGTEPIVSMGHDIPLAVLSEKHQSVFDYFKQEFAQVTNPPIDSLREEIVTDTTVYLGSDGNLLEDAAENCTVLEIDNPILTGTDMMKIRALDDPGFHTAVISLLYYKNTSLAKALDRLMLRVDRAYAEGKNILVLSDRGVDENHMAIPSLIAVAGVEQHLVRTKRRTRMSIVLESGEPRDVHQCACLLGFGARAIYPYLAHECIAAMIDEKILDKDEHTAIDDYNAALLHGIVKIAAKMGISTMQSYQSARIFEAVGIRQDVIDRCFTGIVSRIGGIGLAEIGEGVSYRHDHAFDPLGLDVDLTLDSTGYHKLRSGREAEDHLYNPQTIVALQQATQHGDYQQFCAYADKVEDKIPHTLRGLMEFVPAGDPVPLAEVEPVSEIVKRFKTGAMSYGSLSKEAHETMAIAMNRLGGRSNTGEGGEDSSRFGTERNSRIKQVASGRFGVTESYLMSADEIQIKMAQGAKPGEGGHLPGRKVHPWVAETRFSVPGISLISPPPHHDIYSIEDLAQLIYDLKNANPKARISVKLVSEAGVGTIACGVAKAGAQVILISGFDGGTGAAPSTSVHGAGLPWELGLSEAHHSLMDSGLRERVRLETDGKLMSGYDVAVAALLGAEEFAFATAPLVTMGCMMMRVCSKDTCPVGIATQDSRLRSRFRGKPEYVMNFMKFVAQQLREIMASLGFRTLDEMVGRADCLKKTDHPITHRAAMVDIGSILGDPEAGRQTSHFDPKKVYDFHLEKKLDTTKILPAFADALRQKQPAPASMDLSVTTQDRTVGTMFGSKVVETFGGSLPEDTFTIRCQGSCGQSFGAFLPSGVTMDVHGEANDGFGKGLSGGKLILVPPKGSAFAAEENVIAGNVALYGATSGTAFLRGIVGERFCVRNSGALAVAEGCGDHGLEYMTGGCAVILGPTGKNFAAGMSGGEAYVLDEDHTLYRRINSEMTAPMEVKERQDILRLKKILEAYYAATGSAVAQRILRDFDAAVADFKLVVAPQYRRIKTAIRQYEEQGNSYEAARRKAFEESVAGID